MTAGGRNRLLTPAFQSSQCHAVLCRLLSHLCSNLLCRRLRSTWPPCLKSCRPPPESGSRSASPCLQEQTHLFGDLFGGPKSQDAEGYRYLVCRWSDSISCCASLTALQMRDIGRSGPPCPRRLRTHDCCASHSSPGCLYVRKEDRTAATGANQPYRVACTGIFLIVCSATGGGHAIGMSAACVHHQRRKTASSANQDSKLDAMCCSSHLLEVVERILRVIITPITARRRRVHDAARAFRRPGDAAPCLIGRFVCTIEPTSCCQLFLVMSFDVAFRL